MILHNVNSFSGGKALCIHIKNGKIAVVAAESDLLPEAATHLYFENAMAFPGLINSHDHLDFNLFSQTGNSIYNNYTAWGTDIHKTNKEQINAVMTIPQQLRIQWGLYKNLLCGITTVVEHGNKIHIEEEIITVFQDSYNLHSVGFERNWKYKLNRPFLKKMPVVIHTGEGTDTAAAEEINSLLKWNLFKRKLIAVHGVAMNARQASGFASLVWCPASNYFLLNKTAAVGELKKATSIIFGTDATLTASWNIWDHLRLARKQNSLTDKELFNTVTKTAATAWKMQGKGAIAKGAIADIVVAKTNDGTADSFYAINPDDILLVLHKGDIRLFDESIKDQLINSGADRNKFTKITVGTATKYIWGNISGVIEQIKTYYPQARFPVSI